MLTLKNKGSVIFIVLFFLTVQSMFLIGLISKIVVDKYLISNYCERLKRVSAAHGDHLYNIAEYMDSLVNFKTHTAYKKKITDKGFIIINEYSQTAILPTAYLITKPPLLNKFKWIDDKEYYFWRVIYITANNDRETVFKEIYFWVMQ